MIVRAFLVQMPFTKDLMTEDTNMKIKNKTQCHRAQLGEAPSVPAEPLFADPGGPRPIGSYCPGPGCRADNVHLNAAGFVTHNSRGKLSFWASKCHSIGISEPVLTLWAPLLTLVRLCSCVSTPGGVAAPVCLYKSSLSAKNTSSYHSW